MDIRTPQPSQQAKILRSFLATQGLSVRHTVALEAIARVKGYRDMHAMRADAPDDAELEAILQADASEMRNKNALSDVSIEEVRTALSQLDHFNADNFPYLDFSQYVAPLGQPNLPPEQQSFSGFNLTVCFESDTSSDRIAPFAYYKKSVNTPADGWTERPIPIAHETVVDLRVRLMLKAIKATGVELTAVYDESPKTEASQG